jgi:hypothetical protein
MSQTMTSFGTINSDSLVAIIDSLHAKLESSLIETVQTVVNAAMEAKKNGANEITTIWVSLGFALAVVVLASLVQYLVARRQIRATVLSANRQKWLDSLREELSRFISIMNILMVDIETRTNEPSPSREWIEQNMKELGFVRIKIELLLNPNKPDHKRLIDLVDKAVEYLPKWDTESGKIEVRKMFVEIVSLSQKILKGVWEKVKRLR